MKPNIHLLCAAIILLDAASSRGAEPTTTTTNAQPFKAERAWGGATNGLQLSLAFPRLTYPVGEPIWANIILRNVGQTGKEIRETAQISDFRFTILDEKGAQLPLTPLGEKLENEPESSWSSSRSLQPKDEMKNEHRLDKIWDMRKPGKYRITAIRPVSLDNWMELKAKGVPLKDRFAYIISNTVELEVEAK